MAINEGWAGTGWGSNSLAFPMDTEARIPWPPETWSAIYARYAHWAAWYSGDPIQLSNAFEATVYTPTAKGRFWAKSTANERKVMLHVPIAGDIAGTSADLLFGEPPRFEIEEAQLESAPQGAIDTQDRLSVIADDTDMYARLTEAAEEASAMGGVALKVNWDKSVSPDPILSVVPAENMIPIFKWGILVGAVFHRVIERDGNNIVRLLERHEPGKIITQKWEGTVNELGVQRQLAYEDTAEGPPEVIEHGYPGLMCVYVPNKRPNRIWRDMSLGQSDYAGIEGLMDALDETYTSWIRDLRLARARAIVPPDFLERDPVTGNMQFDLDRELFVEAELGPPGDRDQTITQVQFEIRSAQHKATAEELMDQIISRAGFSPQSFGLKINGTAESGTALRMRFEKSNAMRKKKHHFFKRAIREILKRIIYVDSQILGNKGCDPNFTPDVDMPSPMEEDATELATSVNLLHQAEAASIETRVQMLHPDWEDTRIQEEADRIKQESGIAVTAPNYMDLD